MKTRELLLAPLLVAVTATTTPDPALVRLQSDYAELEGLVMEAAPATLDEMPPVSTPPPEGFYKERNADLVSQQTLCAKNPQTLATIGTAVGSSKATELLEFYAAQMKPLKNISRLLELGVTDRQSASMWKTKLPCTEVQVVAKKFAQRSAFSIDDRIGATLRYTPSMSYTALQDLLKNEMYTVAIISGTHTMKEQQQAVHALWPRLLDCGVLFVDHMASGQGDATPTTLQIVQNDKDSEHVPWRTYIRPFARKVKVKKLSTGFSVAAIHKAGNNCPKANQPAPTPDPAKEEEEPKVPTVALDPSEVSGKEPEGDFSGKLEYPLNEGQKRVEGVKRLRRHYDDAVDRKEKADTDAALKDDGMSEPEQQGNVTEAIQKAHNKPGLAFKPVE